MHRRRFLGIIVLATFSSSALSLPQGKPLIRGEPLPSLIKELPQCSDLVHDDLESMSKSQISGCLRPPNCVGGTCPVLYAGVRGRCVIVWNTGTIPLAVKVFLNLDRPKSEWKRYERLVSPHEKMRLIQAGEKDSDETCLAEWPHQIVAPDLPKRPPVISAPPISSGSLGSAPSTPISTQAPKGVPSSNRVSAPKPANMVHITSADACNQPNYDSYVGGGQRVQGNNHYLINSGSEAYRVQVRYSWSRWSPGKPDDSGSSQKPYLVQPGQRVLLGCSKGGVSGDYNNYSWSIVSQSPL